MEARDRRRQCVDVGGDEFAARGDPRQQRRLRELRIRTAYSIAGPGPPRPAARCCRDRDDTST
jgi:hypothetical protein